MVTRRKDSKGQISRKGDSQRADERYMYRYIDSIGERKTEYSWRSVKSDAYPAEKKKDISLREKEAMVQKDLIAGINIHTSHI